MPAPHSHPKHPGSESRQAQIQKSPPPKFINLDDCKPILSTTTTNTSTNSSRNGATAFVFTSSRTLRALQAQEDRVDRQSPILSARSSPATPPTPSSASSLGYHRAQLTLSQLTRHSEGALDARALIGPKMRAAGFVNLPHTRDSRSDLSSGSSNVPGTPSLHSTHPRDPQWFTLSTNRAASGSGQPNAGTNSNEPTPGPGDSGASPFFPAMATHPPRRIGMPQSMGSYGSDSSALPSSSGSAYTLFSSNPSPSTGISSGDESEGEGALEKDRKGKIKAVDSKPSEYPFPPTYDHSTIWYSRSHGSRASSATASPTTTYAHPPAAQPSPLAVPTWADSARCETTEKPDSPVRPRRASFEKSAKIEPSTEPRASFAAAPRPQSHQRQYSLTELCVSSPMVWLTKSDVFAAPAPISRSPIRTPSLAPTSLSASMSRPRSVLAPPPPTPPPPHRRHRTAPEKISTLRPERHHRIVSAPLRLPAILSECNSSDQDSEKSSSKAGSKKARDRAKRAAKTDSSRMTSAALSSQRSEDGVPAQDPDGNADRGTAARGRGRNPKGKVLAASETVEERAAAEADAEMERTAKVSRVALVLAHRERDREYARHVAATRERDKLLKQKQRVHHKLRGKLVPDVDPDESETTMVEQPSLSAK